MSDQFSTAYIAESFGQGSPLYQILMAQNLVPGESPSYEVCKLLYVAHPLGKKIVDAPISRAMVKRREIVVTEQLNEKVVKQFNDVWSTMLIDDVIANCARLSRIYGISSVVIVPEDGDYTQPLTPKELRAGNIKFNTLDPLNTAGSMVGILDPNDPNFLKYATVAVAGQPYARSRTHVQLYEQPIYLSFTGSAFGYVGRSVFNRALYPMQSFLSSMITDNLVLIKSGVLVAKVKQPGSITDRVMNAVQQVRLSLLKSARTGNTISVMPDESIESLDLHNLDYQNARKNVLENVALSLDMPASFLTGESLAQGFGEGSEDAKLIAGYIDNVRLDIDPLYKFMDNVVQHVAWTPEFYASLVAEGDVPKKMSFDEWFNSCRNSFKALWPSALEPTKKELVLLQKEQYNSVLEVFNTLNPISKGDNAANLVGWVQANLNEARDLFPNRLDLDMKEIIKAADEQSKNETLALKQSAASNKPSGNGAAASRPKLRAK